MNALRRRSAPLPFTSRGWTTGGPRARSLLPGRRHGLLGRLLPGLLLSGWLLPRRLLHGRSLHGLRGPLVRLLHGLLAGWLHGGLRHRPRRPLARLLHGRLPRGHRRLRHPGALTTVPQSGVTNVFQRLVYSENYNQKLTIDPCEQRAEKNQHQTANDPFAPLPHCYEAKDEAENDAYPEYHLEHDGRDHLSEEQKIHVKVLSL